MSYCQDGAVLKLRADGGLDQVVCLHVHSCSGLIQDQDLGLPQQSSGQAHQLPLTHTAGKRQRGISTFFLPEVCLCSSPGV